MFKNYRGRFPFKLATTSYIYPDDIVPNVAKLGPFFDEIELVLFESEKPDSIPDSVRIDQLFELSKLHHLGFNIHLPLDVSLGDEREDRRAHGSSMMKTMIERTLPLHPSVYTLHLDFTHPSTPSLQKSACCNEAAARDRRPGDEAFERKPSDDQLRASKSSNTFYPAEGRLPIPVNEPHSKPEEHGCLSHVCPPIMNTIQSLKGGKKESVQKKEIEAWRGRLAKSLREILDSGIESRRIAIETLAYPFEWIEGMVREFGLSICLDIGHILTHGYDLRHYFETYLPRTSIVHLHGVHKGSDHLGIGALPGPELDLILSALRRYQGIVSIEVFSMGELKNSLSVLEERWT